jgi:hypothetical protein
VEAESQGINAAGQIGNALRSPLDAAGITMTARVEAIPAKPGAARVTLLIDPLDVALEEGGGRWCGELEIALDRQTADRRSLGFTAETARMDFDGELYRRLRGQGFAIARDIDPAPDLRQIRIAVLDGASGRLGSLTVPLN